MSEQDPGKEYSASIHHSTYSTMPCLDPEFSVKNIRGDFPSSAAPLRKDSGIVLYGACDGASVLRRPHCKPEKLLDLCIPVDINLYVLGISSSILRPE